VTLQPVAPLTTDADKTTRYWLATETATATLTPRQYRVTLATPSGTLPGWRIETGEFQIVARNPERSRLLAYLEIERSNVLGNHDGALAEANRLIAANDKDQQAWIVKGDILLLKDDPNAAMQAFDRALGLHKKTEREPIAIQARRREAFQRSLEKRGGLFPQNAPP
jgi:tetratricopeptide (TPR) repeat protein